MQDSLFYSLLNVRMIEYLIIPDPEALSVLFRYHHFQHENVWHRRLDLPPSADQLQC